MNSKEKLYRIIHLALIDIRAETDNNNNKKIFEISNLLHNLPLILLKSKEEDYDKILLELFKKCDNKGLSDWLKNNLID